jgi:Ca2+-dependent lipid-binding protein
VKTGISRNSLNPSWHEQIKAPISSVEEVIRLEVWSSTGLKHSLISGAAIPVADICDASASERWFKLKTESGAFKGELKVLLPRCSRPSFLHGGLFHCPPQPLVIV